jgi:excisionase family DNA binding protein
VRSGIRRSRLAISRPRQWPGGWLDRAAWEAYLLYRVEEAAEALRLSRTAIYELIRSGRLRTVKAGSRRLVPVAALAEYVASLERAA